MNIWGEFLTDNERRISQEAFAAAEMYPKSAKSWGNHLLACYDGLRERIAEANKQIPRDQDGRPIVGMKREEGTVLLSNWVEPWIAEMAALCQEADND